MNKQTKWIISGLCALFLTMMGYVINQLDGLKRGQGDLKVEVARIETTLGMRTQSAALDPPALTNAVMQAKKISTHQTDP